MGRRRTPETAEDLLSAVRSSEDESAALASVAAEFAEGGWKPAVEVLKRVEAVPTIFPQYDYGTRIGGHPLGRICTIHGPSGLGKTSFVIGLMLSFLKRKHFAGFVDAEMTTPIDWCATLMTSEIANQPAFVAMRPSTYEETDDAIRLMCTKIGAARENGRVSKSTSGIVVVDSIRKLVPTRLLQTLLKEGTSGRSEGGIDGMRGRAAMYKAALNAQWLDEMVPLLERTNCTLVIIARETEDPNADSNAKMYGNDWKINGGKALIYDASIAARVTRANWIYQGSGEGRKVVGERHLVRIHKTKVSGKEDKVIDVYFHTSNGVLTPEGFDTTRDLLELAKKFEMVTGETWLAWGDRKFQGENKFVAEVSANRALFSELDAQVRSGFGIEPEPVQEGIE